MGTEDMGTLEWSSEGTLGTGDVGMGLLEDRGAMGIWGWSSEGTLRTGDVGMGLLEDRGAMGPYLSGLTDPPTPPIFTSPQELIEQRHHVGVYNGLHGVTVPGGRLHRHPERPPPVLMVPFPVPPHGTRPAAPMGRHGAQGGRPGTGGDGDGPVPTAHLPAGPDTKDIAPTAPGAQWVPERTPQKRAPLSVPDPDGSAARRLPVSLGVPSAVTGGGSYRARRGGPPRDGWSKAAGGRWR